MSWWMLATGCVFIAPPEVAPEPEPEPVASVWRDPCAAHPVPADLEPITLENVHLIEHVATFCQASDRGTIFDLAWVGSELASAGERSGVQLWEPAQARVRTMAFGSPIHDIEWFADDEFLVLATASGEVFGTDLMGKRRWQAAASHRGSANALAMRPKHGDVISGGEDGWLYRWSLKDGRALAQRNLGAAVADVVTFGKRDVVVCGNELITHALDVATLTPGRSWARERDTSWALAVRPFAGHLAVGGGQMVVWEGELETRYQHPIEGSARSMAYFPEGELLVVGTWGGQMLIYDTDERILAASRKPSEERVLATAVSPDRRFIATAGDGGVIRAWGVLAR